MFPLGLVNHVVEQDAKGEAAYHKCLDIAEEILPNGPFAIQMAKRAINKGIEVDLATGRNKTFLWFNYFTLGII